MDCIEESRLAWQRAQADLQKALAALEKLVADELTSPLAIQAARDAAAQQQKIADELLQRHITQLGKS